MAQLEQLTRGATVKGILPDALITVVDVQWHIVRTVTENCRTLKFTNYGFEDQ